MYLRTESGRRRAERGAAVTPASTPLLASHFFLAAHGLPSAAAAPAPANASPRAAAAAPAIPSFISLAHVPAGTSKLAAHAASCSPSCAAGPSARAAPVLLPHMDDLDEEIAAMGFEKAMVAGAAAGVTEHVFMFPVDTVKTRMQALQTAGSPHYTNVLSSARLIIRDEGARRLYRGFGAVVSGAIPSHAVHYATYEHIKHRIGGNEPGHHPLENGLAGGVATMCHDAIVTPLDVVKQRLQVYNSAYQGVFQCIRSVWAHEGIRAFYASYPTTVALNVPFQVVHFAAYESFKIFFTADDEDHGMVEEVAAGGAAGALAGFMSTPLDLLKTRLQTQEVPDGGRRLGAREMLRQIYAQEGARAFMTGATARMLYFMPSAAICWGTYETMKRVLKNAW